MILRMKIFLAETSARWHKAKVFLAIMPEVHRHLTAFDHLYCLVQ